MNNLIQQKCVPCEGAVDPYSANQIQENLKKVNLEWKVLENKKIKYNFKFKDFISALNFVNKVAVLAEKEEHHPDIYVHNYNEVRIELSIHAIDGLFLNDFIMAAKIEKIKQEFA